MSGDGFSSIESDGSHKITYGLVNLEPIIKEEGCSFTGKCLKDRVTIKDVCSHCRYEAKFDVPMLILRGLAAKNNGST